MVDTSKLENFLNAKSAKHGDLVTVLDEGKITKRDFSQSKDGSDVKEVLEMHVEYNGYQKTYSPNKTTINLWREKFGGDTMSWVGKQGRITIIKQLVVGTVKNIIIVEPV